METQKIKQSIANLLDNNNGDSYATARELLSRRVYSVTGLTLDDLPDTCEIADAVEELADCIDDDINITDIATFLTSFDLNHIISLAL